jgi:hypothetical protein
MSNEINLAVPFDTLVSHGYDLWKEVGGTVARSSLPEGSSKKDALKQIKQSTFHDAEYDPEGPTVRLFGTIVLKEYERIARATRWNPAEYRTHDVEFAVTLSFNPWDMYDTPLVEIEWL